MNEQQSEPTEFHDAELSGASLPSWPKWIGGLAVAWGGLGLPCTGMGALGLAFQKKGVESKLDGAPMPEVFLHPGQEWIIMGIGLALTFLLLFGGIFCIARNPISRMMILGWGLLSIPMALWSYIVQSNKLDSLMAWAELHPSTQYAQELDMAGGFMQIVLLVMTLIFGVIAPSVAIVWFGLIKTKPEQMTGSVESIA